MVMNLLFIIGGLAFLGLLVGLVLAASLHHK